MTASKITNSYIDYEKIVEEERKKYSWFKKSDDDALAKLHPYATSAERLRALIASKGNMKEASKVLGECFQWRKEKGIENMDPIIAEKKKIETNTTYTKEDDIVWFIATTMAYALLGESNLKNPKLKTLPRFLSLASRRRDGTLVTCLKGYRTIQVLNARVDLTQASPAVYALAGAIFVDLIQDRQSMEEYVYTVDTRVGSGWKNHDVNELLPFIQEYVKISPEHFRHRMQCMYIYPVSNLACGLWNVVKPILHPYTRKRVMLIAGPSEVKSRAPAELTEHFSTEVMKYLDKNRKSLFYVL